MAKNLKVVKILYRGVYISKVLEVKSMTLTEKLLQKFQELPKDKQRQTIDFVEFLRAKEQKDLENMMDDVIADNKEAFQEFAK